MSYASIFCGLVKPILTPLGYIRKGNDFYRYMPENQLVKHMCLEMIMGGRQFRIRAEVFGYVDTIYRVSKTQLTLGSIDFYNNLDVATYSGDVGLGFLPNSTYGNAPRFLPFTPEAFSEAIRENLDRFQKALLPEMEAIQDMNDLYAFRLRSHRILTMRELVNSGSFAYEALQTGHLDDAAIILHEALKKREEWFESTYGEERPKTIYGIAIPTEEGGFSEEERKLEDLRDFVKRVEQKDMAYLNALLERRIEAGRALCEAFFQRDK